MFNLQVKRETRWVRFISARGWVARNQAEPSTRGRVCKQRILRSFFVPAVVGSEAWQM